MAEPTLSTYLHYLDQYHKGRMTVPQIAKVLGVSEDLVYQQFRELDPQGKDPRGTLLG